MSDHIPDEGRSLLAKSEEHLSKSDFIKAEKLATTALPADRSGQALCILGACFSVTGRIEEAVKHFEKAFEAAGAASEPALQARALNGLAIIQRSDQHAALLTAERALGYAQQAADKTQEAKALNILGSLHTDLAEYQKALDYYKRALSRAEQIRDDRGVAGYLGNIGNVHRILGEYPRALEYFNRALSLAERIQDRVFVQRNLHLIGEVYSSLADHAKALDFLGRALVLAEQLGNQHSIENLLISIGIVHSSLGDYARALDFYARALALAEQLGDSNGFAACLDNIGSIYWNRGDYERALEHFSRGLAVAEEIGAMSLIANNLGNTGIVYKESGDYDRALDYLERALALSTETGERSQIGHWMHGIASVHHKRGDLENAHRGFLETLRYRQDVLQSNEGVVETMLALGAVLVDERSLPDGLQQFEVALTLASTLGEKRFAAVAHKHIAEIYWSLGDSAKAYDHFTAYHRTDKEVFSEESQKRIEVFHIRNAVADKEREAELQRLRADRSEQELAYSTMQLISQSEIVSKFCDDLTALVSHLPLAADNTKRWETTVREIKSKLKELPSESIDWAKFESQFTSVHPEFKSRLLSRFPDLTKQELKMCQLARLNLKTDEMARLLNLSVRTIDSHRLNLRKKIGLQKEQSLTKFLQDLK
jgi:tetratricopeptide (TPR) repeat protein/DNA-binding CsgD family transcriptional regulator